MFDDPIEKFADIFASLDKMKGGGKSDYGDLFEKHGKTYDVDPDLLRAMTQQESTFNPKAKSPKGAAGLMQIMPGTAKRLGVKNVYDPDQNIEGGAKYMRQLMDMFDNDVPLSLAGYNAGEGAVQKHGNKIPPYKETQGYVKKITSSYSGTGRYQGTKPNADISKFADIFASLDKMSPDDKPVAPVTPTVQGEKPLVRPGEPLSDAPIQTQVEPDGYSDIVPLQFGDARTDTVASLPKGAVKVRSGGSGKRDLAAPQVNAAAPLDGAEVVIRDDIEFDEQGQPIQRPVQDVTGREDDALAISIDAQTVQEGLSKLAAEYGIDPAQVLAQNPNLQLTRPGKIDVTYGDLKRLGVNTDALIAQKKVEQRTESPDPDLSLKDQAPVYTTETQTDETLRSQFQQEELRKRTDPTSTDFWMHNLFGLGIVRATRDAFNPPDIKGIAEERLQSLPQTKSGRRQTEVYNFGNDEWGSYLARLGSSAYKGFVVDNVAPILDTAGIMEDTVRKLIGKESPEAPVGVQIAQGMRDTHERGLPKTTGVPGSDLARGLGQVAGTVLMTVATGGMGATSKIGSVVGKTKPVLSDLAAITKAADDIAANAAKSGFKVNPAMLRGGIIGVNQQMSEGYRRAIEKGASKDQALLAAWLSAPGGFVEGLSEAKLFARLGRIRDLDKLTSGKFSTRLWAKIQDTGAAFHESGMTNLIEEVIQGVNIETVAQLYDKRSFKGFMRDVDTAIKDAALAYPIGGILGGGTAIAQHATLTIQRAEKGELSNDEIQQFLTTLEEGVAANEITEKQKAKVKAKFNEAIEKVKQGVRDKVAAKQPQPVATDAPVQEATAKVAPAYVPEQPLEQRRVKEIPPQVSLEGNKDTKKAKSNIIPPPKVESTVSSDVSGDTPLNEEEHTAFKTALSLPLLPEKKLNGKMKITVTSPSGRSMTKETTIKERQAYIEKKGTILQKLADCINRG